MHPVHQALTPASSSSSLSRQDKATSQRQYREKEGESFSMLRAVIQQLTGEELQTRQEILRKAIDLLSYVLQTKQQEQLHSVPPAPHTMPATMETDTADATSSHLDYFAHPSHWPQDWQNCEPQVDVQGAYVTDQSYGQQYDPMSSTGFAFEQADYYKFSTN